MTTEKNNGKAPGRITHEDNMPGAYLARRAEAFQNATSIPKEKGGCKADIYGRQAKDKRASS